MVVCRPPFLQDRGDPVGDGCRVGDAVDVDDDAGELEPAATGERGRCPFDPGAEDVQVDVLQPAAGFADPEPAALLPGDPQLFLRVRQGAFVQDVGLPLLQLFDDGGLDRVGPVFQRLVGGLDLGDDVLLRRRLLFGDVSLFPLDAEQGFLEGHAGG